MDSLVISLFNFLFNIINTFLNAIFSLPFLLLGQLFDGLVITDFVTNFYAVLNTYIIPSASWFTNIVPPLTWNLIVLYFSFNIALYSVVLVTHYIIKPLRVVKKLIPFT